MQREVECIADAYAEARIKGTYPSCSQMCEEHPEVPPKVMWAKLDRHVSDWGCGENTFWIYRRMWWP
jgi:hypothetical protein